VKRPSRPFNYIYCLLLISTTILLLQTILALASEGMATDDAGNRHVPEIVLAERVADKSVERLSRSTEHALKVILVDVMP
jgi:hypothetical protein